MTTANRRSLGAIARILLAGSLLVGCAQRGSSPVNSGLESLGSDWGASGSGLATLDPSAEQPVSNAQAAQLEKTQRDLEELYANFGAEVSGQPQVAKPTPPPVVQVDRTATAGPQQADPAPEKPAEEEPALAEGAADLPATDEQAPPAEPGLDERIDKAAKELAALLRDRAADATDPLPAHLALEALGAAWPGVLDGLGTESHPGDLAPDEQEVLQSFREIIRGLSDDEAPTAQTVADLLDRVGEDLRGHLPIRITDAALCTRVTGFGQYTPMKGNGLLAGRDNKVILYLAVDRFAHQTLMGSGISVEDGGSNRWSVELAQELKLYKDATPVWSDPSQTIVDTCRVKRKDFYLVQQITLPRTLSVGEYDLKVTVRDRATGSEAQKTIPIRLVVASHLLNNPG